MDGSQHWIAVDWGTSHVRAWKMGGDGAVLDHAQSSAGMSGLSPAEFEPALMALIAPWLGEASTRVVACGMVGARQGWTEAPYVTAPCPPPSGAVAVAVQAQSPQIALVILPGIKQDAPADVMRGEETQIAGFLALEPTFDGVLCLPGTHTKWVRISAGEIVSFQTFMTGELFALLSDTSVLRHSIGSGWDAPAFQAALADSMGRPQAFAQRLFGLRAGSLIAGLGADTARARLSGALIGLELAGAKPYWLGQDIAIIGDGTLAGHYETALAAQGVTARMTDVDRVTLAGLTAAYHNITGTRP